MDAWDLEAEMHGGSKWGAEWDAKVQRARERVAAVNAMPHAEQIAYLFRPCDGFCRNPEAIRIATRNTT